MSMTYKVKQCMEITKIIFFGPIALKRIEHGLGYSESMFYLFQSDWTKNKKLLV